MILKKATTNVSKDIAVGEADGEIIMGKVEALIPCTTGALEKVTVLQPHFDKLKIAGIVKIGKSDETGIVNPSLKFSRSR